jgi:hypothetical protein
MNLGDKIKVNMTFSTFGCSEKYYKEFIHEKELIVESIAIKFITVSDSNNELWSISLEDIYPVKKYIDIDNKLTDVNHV